MSSCSAEQNEDMESLKFCGKWKSTIYYSNIKQSILYEKIINKHKFLTSFSITINGNEIFDR